MARRHNLFLLLLATTASPTLASTTPPDSLLTFPVQEVRARRITAQELADRHVGPSTVLDAASWNARAHSAASVLSRAAGVSVRQRGGLGSYSSVSVRGTSSQQVPIFLDGVPLNNPAAGGVNLADVPLVALDRIEVYRGAAPLTMGGASLGGAIHLVSNRRQRTWLHADAGSFDTRTLQLGGGLRRYGWQWSSRAQAISAQNDWDFFDDNGTPYNPHDDGMVRRANNDVRGGSLLLAARRPWRQWQAELVELMDGREQGSPGHSVVQSALAREKTFTHQFRAALRRHQGRVRSLELYHRLDLQSFYDPEGDLTRIFSDRTDRVHAVGWNVTGGWQEQAPAWWRTEIRHAWLRSKDDLQTVSVGAPQSRWVVAGSIQPRWSPQPGWSISPGARLELHRDRYHGIPEFGSLPQGPSETMSTTAPSFQVGSVWSLGEQTLLKASLRHATRPPALLEKFGVRGSVAGNPDLTSEESVGRDVSLVWNDAPLGRRFAVSIFDNDMWNLITYQRVSAAHARAVNIGRASSRGVEVELKLAGLGPFQWEQDFTYLRTQDHTPDGDDGPLPGRPAMETRTEIAWRHGPGRFAYELVSVGHNYLQSGRRERVRGRVLHSIYAQWALTSQVMLTVSGHNLADQESYDLSGYPLPGRSFRVGLMTGGLHGAP